MNREQRRQAERQQAHVRAHRRVQRKPRVSMLAVVDTVMRPLENIIDAIERSGETGVNQRGEPVFLSPDGEWYQSAGAIEGIGWHAEMLAARRGLKLEFTGVKELVAAFRFNMPVVESTLRKVKESLPTIRRLMSAASAEDNLDVMRQTMIKAEITHGGGL